MIYFIRDGKHVKIGYAQDRARLSARISALQAGNPRPLTLMATMEHGGPQTEKALQELYASWQSGSWFELSPGLTAVIVAAGNGALPAEVIETAKEGLRRSRASGGRAHSKNRRRARAATPEITPAFERLRDWRTTTADGKPAYVVATDATLHLLAQKQPTTLTAMETIRGIGPSFIEKHGASCLACLTEIRELDKQAAIQ
jgi:superfamily II DNA helicase RecQ